MATNKFHRDGFEYAGYGIAFIIVALWLLYLAINFVQPRHDSLYNYQIFSFYLSSFSESGYLPAWIPEMNFGMAGPYYQLTFLGIGSYVSIFLGHALGLTNSLGLYYFSILIDYLVFAIGVIAVSRLTMASSLARIYVLWASTFSVFPLVQYGFTFHIFYALPLCMFWLIKFFEERRLTYLVCLLITELAATIGGAIYFSSIHLLVLSVFFIPYILKFCQSPRVLVVKRDWIFIAGTLLVYGLFIYLLFQTVSNFASVTPMRTKGLFVSRSVFLNWARSDLAFPLLGWITGKNFYGDNTYYIGLIPWGLLLLNAIKNQRKQKTLFQRGIFYSIVVSIGLALGGIIARVVYFFPLMFLYRHISLIYGVIGLLIIFSSAFALDELLGRREGNAIKCGKVKNARQRFNWPLLVLFGDFIYVFIHFGFNPVFGPISIHQFNAFGGRLFVLILMLAIYFVIRNYSKSKAGRWPYNRQITLSSLLLVFLCVDLGVFQYQVNSKYLENFRDAPSDKKKWADINEGKYSFVRSKDISLEHKAYLAELDANYKGKFINVLYRSSNALFKEDTCDLLDKHEALSRSIYDFFWYKEIPLAPTLSKDTVERIENDEEIQGALACDKDIVQFYKISQTVVGNQLDIIEKWKNSATGGLLLVGKNNSNRVLGKADQSLSPGADTFRYSVVNYPGDRLLMNVVAGADGWLYFADAYDKRWRAYIDGAEVPILRANIGFKAIRLAKGAHVVDFVISPLLVFATNFFPVLLLLMLFSTVVLAVRSLMSPSGMVEIPRLQAKGKFV